MTTYKRKDRVRILAPGPPPVGNPRLHGTGATVDIVTDWGCLLRAPAAATGMYRAAWGEMELLTDDSQTVSTDDVQQAILSGYLGDPCSTCGALKLRMSGGGGCTHCDSCGTNSGCG